MRNSKDNELVKLESFYKDWLLYQEEDDFFPFEQTTVSY
jgi:hypothetical protein